MKWLAEEEAGGAVDHGSDDEPHGEREELIGTGGCMDVAQIEPGEQGGEGDAPEFFRNACEDVCHGSCAPDRANHGVEDVIHEHGPASKEAECGVEFLADVGVSGAGIGVDRGHAPIREGCEHHAEHCDEDGCDDVALGRFVDHTKQRRGCSGLDHDDTGEYQGGEREGAAEFWGHWGQLYNSRVQLYDQGMPVRISEFRKTAFQLVEKAEVGTRIEFTGKGANIDS